MVYLKTVVFRFCFHRKLITQMGSNRDEYVGHYLSIHNASLSEYYNDADGETHVKTLKRCEPIWHLPLFSVVSTPSA